MENGTSSFCASTMTNAASGQTHGPNFEEDEAPKLKKQYALDDIRNIEWKVEIAPYDPDREDMHAPPG